jgi:hypothetical protein
VSIVSSRRCSIRRGLAALEKRALRSIRSGSRSGTTARLIITLLGIWIRSAPWASVV